MLNKFLLIRVWFLLVLAGVSIANARALPDFVGLVESSAPAVVKIQVETASPVSKLPGWPLEQEVPESFRRFFQIPDQQGGAPQQGLGSGFIIEADGYILTNHHVIANADRITVRLNDRREFEATVVGSDERSDIALLKVETKGLPVVRLAKQDDLKVGEWVLAIGSPFGLDYSVSQGIVSAIGRSLPNERNENYVPFIQTDVAINPGNSGGPLFNLDGEVVGINSQIFTRSGGSMGLSFAIPASVVSNVVEQLRDRGSVSRGWLGVSIQEVDTALAESFGLSKPEGALVAQIMPDGPADTGGIKVGDIITSFNDKPILFSSDLPHQVGQVHPGTRADIRLVRNGNVMTLSLEVGQLPGDVRNSSSSQQRGKNKQTGITGPLGLALEPLPPSYRERLGVNGGVLVSDVKQGSAAARAGLEAGDVITQLGFSEVDSPESLRQIAKALPSGSVQPIRFFRGDNPIFRSIMVE
jgi:serine protease Do